MAAEAVRTREEYIASTARLQMLWVRAPLTASIEIALMLGRGAPYSWIGLQVPVARAAFDTD